MARKKKIDKEMGFRLKQARTEQKLTYEELAEKSGVSSRYIKEIENHGNVPSLEKLGQLIRALHISADPFFIQLSRQTTSTTSGCWFISVSYTHLIIDGFHQHPSHSIIQLR